MKWDVTRHRWVWAVLLTTVASLWPGREVNAGVYERRIPSLEGVYGYGEFRQILFDFDTAFASISRVEVELSGSATNGWYDERIWPDYPLPATFSFLIGPRSWPSFPRHVQLKFESDGAFALILPIPAEGIAPDWSRLLRGRTSMDGWHEQYVFLGDSGGGIVRTPYLEITNFILRVEAVPVLKLSYNGATSELRWSSLPSGGRLQIHSASAPDGAWELVGDFTHESAFPKWTVGNTGSRFLKGVWVEDAVAAPSD